MAQAVPFIVAAVSVAGTYMQYKSQSEAAAGQEDAAREAQRQAEINAKMQEKETAVEAANLSMQQEKEEAANRARAAASGLAVAPGGSYSLALEEQKATNQRQLEWLKASGQSYADMTRMQGASAYRQGMSQAKASQYGAYGALASGASNVYGIGKNEGWF